MIATNTATTQRRTLHVEHCMGTAFTIDIRDAGTWGTAIADAVAWLHHVDAVFSTYKPASDISRIQRGELRIIDADPDVAVVLELCEQVRSVSGGYFTDMPHGRLDPTGLVKGWAIKRASELLHRHGSHNHAVNGGGDMQLAGESSPGSPWRIGISDPHCPLRTVTVITGRNLAVATSGISERGQHITNPIGGLAAVDLASVTVVGPSLTYADAYATAAFARGRRALPWVESLDNYEALLIAPDATTAATTGWSRITAAAGSSWPAPLSKVPTAAPNRHVQVIGRSVAGTGQVGGS
jgi:thiamine biosynthesis lipoprotein